VQVDRAEEPVFASMQVRLAEVQAYWQQAGWAEELACLA
jgi:hypothetical protein